MEDLLMLMFSGISEKKDFCDSVRSIEMKMRESLDVINVPQEENEKIKCAMYEILGIAEQVFFKIGFNNNKQEFPLLLGGWDELKKEHTFLKCDEHCAIIDSVDKKSTDRSDQEIH